MPSISFLTLALTSGWIDVKRVTLVPSVLTTNEKPMPPTPGKVFVTCVKKLNLFAELLILSFAFGSPYNWR